MLDIKRRETESTIAEFDEIAVDETPISQCPFWGSARMTLSICAFLALLLHVSMRNALNLVILCMVRDNSTSTGHLQIRADETTNSTSSIEMQNSNNTLNWTRSQEISLQGTFYYGYLISLPIGGHLTDIFGGKLFLVHSITLQAVVMMLIPLFSKLSYAAVVVTIIVQGFIAGFGNPPLYQLFSTWAHPTERTTILSFVFGGYPVGSLLVFAFGGISCKFGWESAFYITGGVSLLCGIIFHWLVFNSLEEHPRISKKEYDYLKPATQEKAKEKTAVPWRDIITSVPIYSFIFTHIFHSYGLLVLTIMLPRFLNEAMKLSITEAGLYSTALFVGCLISKLIIFLCFSRVEKCENLNMTIYRRIVYVVCNFITISGIMGIIFIDYQSRFLMLLLTTIVGISIDIGFSVAYWPSLLFLAPSYAGLLSGIANCLANVSGFLIPIGISLIVRNGTKFQWDYVLLTIIVAYALGAAVYGLFGSSKLQQWAK